MGFKEDCTAAVAEIATTPFDIRAGSVVPKTSDVVLRNGAVELDAAYLYADMADSTGLARHFSSYDAARIIRAYLNAVSRVIRHRGGAIRSFDGDRVMAIFVGDDAASIAAKTALNITWVVDKVVHEQLSDHIDDYFTCYIEDQWRIRHRTGIDIGTALVVRAGVRDNNDLVSIGDAPNIAAKLSDVKQHRTTITERTWDALDYASAFREGDQAAMWSAPRIESLGSRTEEVRGSDWWWSI
ncbi:adenylate/guanylate cyclase domain-containing protein [Nocardia brasiliensis]|uniref:adenylate/guanylate cyclase domain-containing protein n=1 Tax=Nocardia brasiliensis TaxID=37326 RepID=UPI0004A72EEB|nr:adenylate/guanylate cyclase domain-containing protein [Nocardia brasiliensis]